MFELLSNKTYRLLFILAIISTLILTLSVPVGLVKAGLINDKLAHAITFFVLSFLYSHTVGIRFGLRELILLAGLGLVIELIQYALPWRSFSWLDWLADIAGILGYELIHRLKKVWLSKNKKV